MAVAGTGYCREMPQPQQPELSRSGRGSATQESAAKERAGKVPEAALKDQSGIGPVPEANQPGHHPEQEQDKPAAP